MSDEICECGHSKSAHYFAEGEPGHCVLACECTQYRPRKEQKKYCRCGHTEEEHHRVVDDGGGVLWLCRVKGCNCNHFREESLTDYYRRISGDAPKPRVKFARFVFVLHSSDDAGPDHYAGPHFDVLINPEDVSSILGTQNMHLTQVALRNGQVFLVQGTVDEVQKKLQEV